MWRWVRHLLGIPVRGRERRAPRVAGPGRERPAPAAEKPAPRPAGSSAAGRLPVAAPFAGEGRRDLAREEAAALRRVERAVRDGRLEMPRLSTTSVRLTSMLNDRNVEVADLVDVVSADPVLSTELLKMANSARFAARIPVESIREAITRIGLRKLRSVVYAISVQGMIMRHRALEEHAREVWRQAYSAASVAEAVAPALGMDPEKAFMIGLLHDVGRIPLLALLSKEAERVGQVSEVLVGRVFHRLHELAGAKVAEAWKLSEELASVAGKHHAFAENELYPLSAALASLAHRLDLLIAMGVEDDELAASPELDFLEVHEERRGEIVTHARRAHDLAHYVEPTTV